MAITTKPAAVTVAPPSDVIMAFTPAESRPSVADGTARLPIEGVVSATPSVTLTSPMPICRLLPLPGEPVVLPSLSQTIVNFWPAAIPRPLIEACLRTSSPSAVE